MAYTPTPNFVFLNIFQWELPEAPNPRLASPIEDDATVFKFTAPPKDKGAIITGNLLMNVKNNAGYTENCYVPSGTLAYDAQTANFAVGEIVEGATSGARAIVAADTDDGATGTLTLASVVGTFQNDEVIAGDAGGSADVNGTLTNSMSADGLTASNVVRGVRLNGLDFFTTDTTLRAAHEVNQPVRCVISPVYNQIVFDWILGRNSLGSGGNELNLGKRRAEDHKLNIFNDHTSKPFINFEDAKNTVPVLNRGDDQTQGDEPLGTLRLTAAEMTAQLANFIDGQQVYDTTNNVQNWKEAGNFVANQAGGTVADATNVTSGKSELVTATEADNADDTGTTGPNVMIPSETARVIQEQRYQFGVESGVADAYVVTNVPPITAYREGQSFEWVPLNSNTGASTVNYDGVGVENIVNSDGTALTGGEIVAGNAIRLTRVSGSWQFTSPTAQSITGFVQSSSIDSQAGQGTRSTAAGDGNIDIDLSPFTDTDKLQLFITITNKPHVDEAGTGDDRATNHLVVLNGVLGGEYAGWRVINNNVAGVTGTSPFGDGSTFSLPEVISITGAADLSSASASNGIGDSSQIIVEDPTMSGNTLSFPIDFTVVSSGFGQVDIGVVAARLSE